MRFIDLTGKRFGKLRVLGVASKDKHIKWHCICDCGKKKEVLGCHLRSGKIISCGCASVERISLLNKTHGDSKTRLYSIWAGIKSRCYDKNCSCYNRYGQRSIIMCDKWKNDYLSFKTWALRNGYSNDLTIDRIDNDGNYEPSNCRWVNNYQQSNNTSRTVKIEYNGNLYSAKQVATLLNINYKKFLYGYHKFNKNLYKAIDYAKLYKKRR